MIKKFTDVLITSHKISKTRISQIVAIPKYLSFLLSIRFIQERQKNPMQMDNLNLAIFTVKNVALVKLTSKHKEITTKAIIFKFFA